MIAKGYEVVKGQRMIEVFILDDHPIVRQGLEKVLEEEPDMRLTGQAGTWLELVELLESRTPDVIILDISMPDRSGMGAGQNQAARQIIDVGEVQLVAAVSDREEPAAGDKLDQPREQVEQADRIRSA